MFPVGLFVVCEGWFLVFRPVLVVCVECDFDGKVVRRKGSDCVPGSVSRCLCVRDCDVWRRGLLVVSCGKACGCVCVDGGVVCCVQKV